MALDARRLLGAAGEVLRDLPRLLTVWWRLRQTRRGLQRDGGGRRLALHTAEPPRARRRLAPEEIRRWRLRVDRAARLFANPPTCLARCLCLQDFLAAAGQPTDLRIGVRRSRAELEAHAWLEIDGQSVTPDHGAAFAPLRRLSESETVA